MQGVLYVVATPIGNLADSTLRSLRVLREVDVIACEDTRAARRMLERHGITTRTCSYFEHNKHTQGRYLLDLLSRGKQIALITDGGTPGISDPGADLVRLAHAAGIRVVPVPGPSAVAAAISVSGLPGDRFVFAGFLPAKRGRRRARLREIASLDWLIVFYESCHRIGRMLEDVLGTWGDCEVLIARELTKLHEEILRGRISDLLKHASITRPRGEFVVIVCRATTAVASSTKATESDSETLPEP